MAKFESDFGMMSNSTNDPLSSDGLFIENTDDSQEPDDIILLHMDIREPISKLKILLERKVGLDLRKYKFWLQDAQILEPHKNLVDQCVEGEGIVQINVQVQTESHRINIVDVLKPTEEALEMLANEPTFQEMSSYHNLKIRNDENRIEHDKKDSVDDVKNKTNDDDDDDDDEDDDENGLKWILDVNCQFKRDQSKLKIPDDPVEWSVPQVQHWLQWAVREFNMSQIKLNDWQINGEQLCNMSLKEFEKKVPSDPGNIFRTHFELLRKCKLIAVLQSRGKLNVQHYKRKDDEHEPRIMKKIRKRSSDEKEISGNATQSSSSTAGAVRNINWENTARNTNGQIQLWQFLLDLLTDYEYRSIIQWISGDGEFRLIDPEQVAKLWGTRKNKPSMNYEKLSRALRYYYDGDMISKVHGKRFVYKFVCDLKQLIGYDARELARLVNQCVASSSKKARIE